VRFYSDLARFWPLLSPVEDYAEEAGEAARLLRAAARPVEEVLELGAGGGHNAFHLRRWFRMTLSDLSPEMLACSRAINPGCEHVEGDMRTLRLGRTFDAVFVHDAVDYMTSEADLASAIATARAHLRPGGLVLLTPDHTSETFAPATECGGTDGPDGRGIRYLEWTHDPDPSDGQASVEYALVTRDADGRVAFHGETHTIGLFPRATWLRLLEASGLRAEAVEERTTEDRAPRTLFVGHRPAGDLEP
jgi:SAM-dependent methyltransferase